MFRVIIHLENPSGGPGAWWAESPDLDGFTAAAPSLTELRVISERALREIVEEAGGDPLSAAISWHFAPADESTSALVRMDARGVAVPVDTGAEGVERVAQVPAPA